MNEHEPLKIIVLLGSANPTSREFGKIYCTLDLKWQRKENQEK